MKVPVVDIDGFVLYGPKNLTGTPERNLMLAVLERAILDFVGNDEREVEAAQEWLFEELEEPLEREFSFKWICRQLDLDFRFIAEKIRQMPKRGSRRVAPWYFAEAAG